MEYYIKALKHYADFSGRARRKEYWMFVLFNIIFAIAAMVLDNILGTKFHLTTLYGTQALPYGYVYVVYALILLIPGLSIAVRRLHDVGKSGWFILIGLIPLIGAIWLIVLFCTEGYPGVNEYGENPKGVAPELI